MSRNCRCDYYRFLQSFETETPLKAKTKISLYWTLSELGYFSKEKNSQGLQIQRRTMIQRYKDTKIHRRTMILPLQWQRSHAYITLAPQSTTSRRTRASLNRIFWCVVIIGPEEYLWCGHIWSRAIFQDIMLSHECDSVISQHLRRGCAT